MPVGAQGSNFRLLAKQEASEGVLATGNFSQLPAYTFELSGAQELQSDQILSANAGRDASDPFLDVLTVQGNARVPVDLVNFGTWLKLLLASPVTTGTTDMTHVFSSGATGLPTDSFEKAFPDVAQFFQYTGVRANTLQLDFSPSGAADATFGLLGTGETKTTTTAAGTPTLAAGFTRFLKKQGAIKMNGTTLGRVTAGTLNFSNNMEPVRTIRSDDRLEGVDFGQATAEGNLTVRFSDGTLIDQAVSNTPASLEYSYTISGTKSLTFLFPRVFLSRPGIPVNGPGGIDLAMTWRASNNGSSGTLMQVTLKNAVAGY
ncbi:phage tail tube protein [Roseomonas sp. NAR14]|uniref:Phage tail tube protein n=1 Tax=Roseomonas acroporae TaxID=2937791 RepID=A0A9X1YEK2_9PROT|nr:phage tail tube protein [Roseomonas acroporae]MCK8787640.1 phage tail tube protein [Roseomonas acroporae]